MPEARPLAIRSRGRTAGDAFEASLSLAAEDVEVQLRGVCSVPWADFLLNPRRLRGSDFLMRWSQGVWSEKRIVQAVAQTGEFLALPYGPSGVAPDSDVREFELYFERLEAAGLGQLKRPDLLMFRRSDASDVASTVRSLGGERELPFTSEDAASMRALLRKAILAVECENSLWRAQAMPAYGKPLKPMARLGGKPGLPKGAVIPTVILKHEDRAPLAQWQRQAEVPIHIWHVFYDLAFGISFDVAERMIEEGAVEPREQVFQAPGGAMTTKVTFNIPYHHAYALGTATEEPTLVAAHIEDRNGHILPYVRFEGGRLSLAQEAIRVLREAANRVRE